MLALTSAIEPNPWFILPFVALLACIALGPFLAKNWWPGNYAKVAVGLGLVTAIYYIFGLRAGDRIGHVMLEYFSFICLIGSLFVVCGGIQVTVAGEAKPWGNVAFLLIGAVLANIVGTTGASMLMIRPWLRMNKFRYAGIHTAFFIFIVSNVGGSLTPIGDPPLFLGYLKGVPFSWPLRTLWVPWSIVIAMLLAVFAMFDIHNFRNVPKAVRAEKTAHEKFVFRGLQNSVFLLVILGAIFVKSPWRELAMIVAAAASYFTTHADVHRANDFTFHPIVEVGWLFLGIFATMVPALDYLAIHSHQLGISAPMALYYSTGFLSAVLDNAPTYLSFLVASVSQFLHPGTQLPMNANNPADIAHYLQAGKSELMAISLGSVWFGAMTYIGNGPNFMVKAVVEHSGCKAPHFLEYIYRYSLPILLPILVAVGSIVFLLRF